MARRNLKAGEQGLVQFLRFHTGISQIFGVWSENLIFQSKGDNWTEALPTGAIYRVQITGHIRANLYLAKPIEVFSNGATGELLKFDVTFKTDARGLHAVHAGIRVNISRSWKIISPKPGETWSVAFDGVHTEKVLLFAVPVERIDPPLSVEEVRRLTAQTSGPAPLTPGDEVLLVWEESTSRRHPGPGVIAKWGPYRLVPHGSASAPGGLPQVGSLWKGIAVDRTATNEMLWKVTLRQHLGNGIGFPLLHPVRFLKDENGIFGRYFGFLVLPTRGWQPNEGELWEVSVTGTRREDNLLYVRGVNQIQES